MLKIHFSLCARGVHIRKLNSIHLSKPTNSSKKMNWRRNFVDCIVRSQRMHRGDRTLSNSTEWNGDESFKGFNIGPFSVSQTTLNVWAEFGARNKIVTFESVDIVTTSAANKLILWQSEITNDCFANTKGSVEYLKRKAVRFPLGT